MKFTCDRCGKRYATADEPVPGRVYKLACKRCGHAIVVRAPATVVAPAAVEARTSAAEASAPREDPVTSAGPPAAPEAIESADAPAAPESIAGAGAPAAQDAVTAAEAPAAEPDGTGTASLRAEEPPSDEPIAGAEPAGAEPARPRRSFELSRMQRERAGLPVPLLVVGLLIVVALVVAVLLR